MFQHLGGKTFSIPKNIDTIWRSLIQQMLAADVECDDISVEWLLLRNKWSEKHKACPYSITL
jgi:hypothetical protein